MTPLENLLHRYRKQFTTVLPRELQWGKAYIMDLSENSKELKNVDISNTAVLIENTKKLLAQEGARIAIGRYNENRTIYQRSPLFTTPSGSLRTIHLGIDLMVPPGTPIASPYDGIIHGFKNTPEFGNYGPTIILKHEIESTIFFTLYGHLAATSLERLSQGKKIVKGEVFAAVGTPKENGNWPPHLHFQVIDGEIHVDCDFPGVIEPEQHQQYLKMCPDPNLILNIPALQP